MNVTVLHFMLYLSRIKFTQAIEGENFLDATDVNASSNDPRPFNELSPRCTSDVMLEATDDEPPRPSEGQHSPKL
ncbi:hypothetical protein AC249_AIPGENE18719 [Exaiptasia diaphana]|nr:hypothetical protein AC249_AIPGENE18719 [Exaiptasia diaphana]